MTPIGPPARCARARRRWRPTFACRFRGSPTACAKRSATSSESRLVAPILGHVGDGNFHLSLMVDLDDADEVARAKDLLERLVERALAMDGTCTGEHGVGQGKMKYLLAEHGEPALAVMRAHQTGARPARHPQSGQDRQSLIARSWRQA